MKLAYQQELERLMKIATKRDSVLTPHDVVEAAEPKTNPLHDYFLWDDKKAGEEHRLYQARHLIETYEIRFESKNGTGELSTRGYVNVIKVINDAPTKKPLRGYSPIEVVMKDESLRRQFLSNGYQELLRWQERYRCLTEFARVCMAINELILEEKEGGEYASNSSVSE